MKHALAKSLAAISMIIPTASAFSQEHEPILFDSDNVANNIPEKETIDFGWPFDLYPSVHYPAAVHWFQSLSVLGDSITLEDGSVWRIAEGDQSQLASWIHNDPLMITQNRNWCTQYEFSSDQPEFAKRWTPQKRYPLIIMNKKTNGKVQAKLQEGPWKGGMYSRYIIAIDYGRREVKLSDNSHWSIAGYDETTFKDWALRECVIIGFNSGWDNSYEGILINVTRNNVVRVKQY